MTVTFYNRGKKISSLVLLLLAVILCAKAQTGPGGIGNASGNLFWYKADAITGQADGTTVSSWQDQSGNAVNASVFTSAVELDGNDDEVIPVHTNQYAGVTNSFTMEAWVFPDQNVTHEIDVQSQSGTLGTSGQKYLIYPAHGQNVFGSASHAGAGISVAKNGVSVYEHSGGYLPALLVWQGSITTWTHIAVVYQNKQTLLYVNGDLVATGLASTKSYVHPSPGLGGGSYGHYAGKVDELHLWDHARTEAQIEASMYIPVITAQPGLLGNWHLNEGSGNSAHDGSGASGYLELINGAHWTAQHSAIFSGMPIYHSSGSWPVVSFNGLTTLLGIPSVASVNSAPVYTSRLISLTFRTSAGVTARQVLYEEGKEDKGLNIYIDNGSLYFNGWNTSIDDADPAARLPWGPKYVSTAIQPNTNYIISLVYDYDKNILEGYLNGNLIGTQSNVGKLYAHPAASIGSAQEGTRFHDYAASADGFVFNGHFAEVIAYGNLNTSERKLIENYLSSKYSIAISNDYYAFESSFSNDLRGIGKDNAQNTYLSATSGFLTISGTAVPDGYFTMFAHNNAGTNLNLTGYLTSSDNTPRNVMRFGRTWKADATGTASLNFSIPQSYLPVLAPYQRAVLLLDNDGNFRNGSRVVALNASGANYTIDNIQVLDEDQISFGILNIYGHSVAYNTAIDALGKADVNYTDLSLTSSGLSIRYPSSGEAGDYLLLANNGSAAQITNVNTPYTDITRSSRVWKVNEYGDVGQAVLIIDPSAYPLPSGMDTYLILIDRDQDGDFSNAESLGAVREGAEYRAYYIGLNEGDLITIGAAVSGTAIMRAKTLTETFREKAPDADLSSQRTKELVIREQKKYEMASPCVDVLKKATLHLLFNTGEDYIFGNNAFTTTVAVEVKGYDTYSYTSSTTPKSSYFATLTIDKNAPEVLQFFNVTDDYNRKGVKVYEVKIASYTPSSIAILNSNLEMKAYVEEERDVTVPLTDASAIISMDYASTGKVYTFSWDTDHCGAPFYQFQLLKLYNTADPANPDEHNITASPDWSQALTLETTAKGLSLTMVEGTGYYAWRVRPAGNHYTGGGADSRNWGTWSTASIQIPSPLTLPCTASNLSTCLSNYAKTVFYYDQFDREKNFIYARTFSEDNKIHEGITYANGLNQIRQVQAKLPSNNTETNNGQIIANQVLYDYSGRSAANSLPAPLLDYNSEFGYRQGLIRNSNGGVYGPQNFDTDSKLHAPDPIDPVNGGWISRYYSDYNPDPNVAGAEGYPFSRTLFDNEGGNNVIESGGPGNKLRVGNGHTVRVQYGSVAEDELLRIFGDEAPRAESVYKVATTDQNNITSIAYKSKEGKTIATCLANNDLSSNLTPLASGANGEFSIKELITENVPFGDNGLLASKALNFTESTEVKVSYEITPKIITSFCGDFCSSCGYKVKIKILDLANPSNNKIIQTAIAPGTVKDISLEGNCTSQVTPVDLDPAAAGNELTITLPAGKYIIEKIIELDKDAAQTYATNIVSKVDLSLKPFVDQITGYLDNSNVTGLVTYLQTIQTASAGDVDVEVYSESDAVLYSLIDNDPANNTPLATLADGSKVKLITTCCALEIPVILPEYDPCIDEANDGNMGVYFAGYLLDKTGLSISAASGGKYTNTSEFNTLIENMLGETYYKCDDLWFCWKTAVASMGAFSGIDVDAGVRGQDDFSNFPTWVQDKGNNSTISGPDDLIENFLSCANYHFAGFTTDPDLLKYKPYKYFYYDHANKTTGQTMCENAYCNSTVDPEADFATDMFYSPCSSGDMCQKDYNQLSDNGDTYYTLTVGRTSAYAGKVLTESDYYNLYRCMKNQVTDQVNPTDYDVREDIEAQKAKLESECRTACDDKYDYFLASLVQMYGGTRRLAGTKTTWGPELQENGDFGKKTGGWYVGSSPVTLKTGFRNGQYNLATGIISSGNLLSPGKSYKLSFRNSVGVNVLKVYNGTTLLYERAGVAGAEDKTLTFTATGSNLIFQAYAGVHKDTAVMLDNVSLREAITYTADEVSYEDMCCTARKLVDYCREECNLTIVTADCSPSGTGPEDKFVSLGTKEEIEKIRAIMYGTFQVEENYPSYSCGAGYEPGMPSLQSYYGMGGDARDGSGYELHGTINGATLTTDRNSNAGSAYSFNGVSNYINAGADNRNITSRVTVSAWINTSSNAYQWVVGKYNYLQTGGYHLYVNSGKAGFGGRDGSGNYRSTGLSNTVVNDGNWHHLVGICDVGTWKLYVDGVLEKEVATGYMATDLTNTDPLTIGNYYQGQSGNQLYFNGKIDEVFVHNQALTSYQIQQQFTTQFSPYTKTPGRCLTVEPVILWDNTIGTQDSDALIASFKDAAGNYIMAGSSSYPTNKFTMTRMNASGAITRQVDVLSGQNAGAVNVVRQTSDGGYILAGSAYTGGVDAYGNPLNMDMLLVKLNANFDEVWRTTAGGSVPATIYSSNSDWAADVQEVQEGGLIYYLAAGATSCSDIPGSVPAGESSDGYLVKFNASGQLLWQKIIASSGRDRLSNIVLSSDGKYLLHNPSQYSYWGDDFYKVDTNGTILWSKKYPVNSAINMYFRYKPTTDGGVVIWASGTLHKLPNYPGNASLFVTKLNASGTVVWEKWHKPFDQSTFAGSLGPFLDMEILPGNNGFIFAGEYTTGWGGDPADDAYILKLDNNGDIADENIIGGNNGDHFTDIALTNDGGFLCLGTTYSTDIPGRKGQSGNDLYLVKFNAALDKVWEKVIGTYNNYDYTVYSLADYGRHSILSEANDEILITATSSGTNDAGSDMTYPNHSNNNNSDIWPIKLGYRFTCNPKKVCIKWNAPENPVVAIPVYIPPVVTYNQQTITYIKTTITSQLQNCKATNEQALKAEYNRQCGDRNAINDRLQVEYKLRYHHYTLYYHDRAGNLVKTVPPQGVQLLDLTDQNVRNRQVHPTHSYVSAYKYNSLEQLKEQSTPDGGVAAYIYNNMGQLRFSQNAKQGNESRFSYSKYDYLGRIIEVGESPLPSGNIFSGLNTGQYLNNTPLGPASYPAAGASQQIYTVYSEEAANVNYLGNGQTHLENRVSYTYSLTPSGEKAVTYFSYDAHGNIVWASQEVPGLSKNYIGYEYDLISNKLLKAKYNEGLPDQFFHKYEYDADNRIVSVYTSRDGKLWDKDAKYNYYKHGPLKRTEIGEDKLQGLDYAYTLQGWLKGLNTPRLNATDDPGQDGTVSSKFVSDEYGMVLGYYAGDFIRTNSVYNSDPSTGSALNLNSDKPLYNGNITSWTGRIEEEYRDAVSPPTSHQFTAGNVYTYDHLNRILQSDYKQYNGSAVPGNSYSASNDYQTGYSYDANGNLMSLMRKGHGANPDMDDLAYSYQTGNNKLRRVTDAVAGSVYTEDLESQVDADNYQYDDLGNLIKDKQEGLEFTWNVFGKLSEVKRISPAVNTKPEIRFTYDASGNRIRKEVNTSPYDVSGTPQRLPENIETTYYVRDNSGNTMAVYERKNTAVAGQPGYYKATYKAEEFPIYGSSRVGMYTPGVIVAEKVFHVSDQDKISYETEAFERSGEYVNWEGTTLKKDLIMDNGSQQQLVESSSLHLLSYNAGSGSISASAQLSFLGKTGENISIAEDESGSRLFYAVTAVQYWGKDNVCLVYDATGRIMPGSSGIFADGNTRSVIVQKPGSFTEYYLINRTPDGKLRYNIIDLSLPGNGTASAPLGDVKSSPRNEKLDVNDNNDYGTSLTALENKASGRTMIYATRHIPGATLGTMKVVAFEISEKGPVVQDPLVMAGIANLQVEGQSEMKISEDGRKLLVINHKQTTGWFDHQESEIKVYNLGYDHKLVYNNLVNEVTIPVPDGAKQGASAEFSKDGRFVYYTRDLLVERPGTTPSPKTLWRYDLRNGAVSELQVGMTGDLRRGRDGRLYVADLDGTKLFSFTENQIGASIGEPSKDVFVGSYVTGHLSSQNHKIYREQVNSSIFARDIGSKHYEISDHLGNVTLVFNDRKGAAIAADVTNHITVESYNNYYPYGMMMPGRHKEGSEGYRYGFNGQEKDDEILNVSGSIYTAEYWQYDTRTGRRWNRDLVDVPSESPYATFRNNPILFADINGDCPDCPQEVEQAPAPAAASAGAQTSGAANASIPSTVAQSNPLGNIQVGGSFGTARQTSYNLTNIDLSSYKVEEYESTAQAQGGKRIPYKRGKIVAGGFTIELERTVVRSETYLIDQNGGISKVASFSASNEGDNPSKPNYGVVANGKDGGTVYIYDAPSVHKQEISTYEGNGAQAILRVTNFKERLVIRDKSGKIVHSTPYTQWSSTVSLSKKADKWSWGQGSKKSGAAAGNIDIEAMEKSFNK